VLTVVIVLAVLALEAFLFVWADRISATAAGPVPAAAGEATELDPTLSKSAGRKLPAAGNLMGRPFSMDGQDGKHKTH